MQTTTITWRSLEEETPEPWNNLICYREDQGVFICWYGSLEGVTLEDGKVEELTEEQLFNIEWYARDMSGLDPLSDDLIPTHWAYMPDEPDTTNNF